MERASNAAGVAGVEVPGRRQWGWRCREEAVFSRLVVPETTCHSLLYLVSSAQAPPMRPRLRKTKSLPMVTYSRGRKLRMYRSKVRWSGAVDGGSAGDEAARGWGVLSAFSMHWGLRKGFM